MQRFLIAGLLFFIVIHTGYAQTVTTFILVRHAEKVIERGGDPELKPEGIKRSEVLAALFSKATIDAVYSTDYKRTRHTVTPLAAARGLSVNLYSTLQTVELENLITKHAGGTIVIAGHSDTIPEIANTLTGVRRFQQFADDDYGNILVISVSAVGKDAKVVWLRY